MKVARGEMEMPKDGQHPSRGTCSYCNQPVLFTDRRKKGKEPGSYVHKSCLEKEQNKASVASPDKLVEDPAAARARESSEIKTIEQEFEVAEATGVSSGEPKTVEDEHNARSHPDEAQTSSPSVGPMSPVHMDEDRFEPASWGK